ncbi:hypothetical protein C4588_06155 [Candidatus Parcubacteria bacterium]|nr:MAG: hypothetical protein C4588_06155 [Candidatus Parcubacteria bacterium]
MNETEYRAYPALSSSNLSAFYNKGIYSPDHALMTVEFKSYFEYGHQLETMIRDAVKGTDTFHDRFYITELDGKMPDEMIGWIDNKEDLSEKYVYTQKGDLSGTCKTRHAFLDEAMKNPGKIPVSKADGELLKRHTENMIRMEYLGAKVGDILAKAEWQVPIIFKDYDDLEKKALVDCLVDLDGEFLLVDIKTTASFQKFGFMIRDRYFIQDLLYTNGVNIARGMCTGMVFFVASKEAPFLCQPVTIDYGGTDFKAAALEEFYDLCRAYKEWSDAGRRARGYLPQTIIKRYPKI